MRGQTQGWRHLKLHASDRPQGSTGRSGKSQILLHVTVFRQINHTITSHTPTHYPRVSITMYTPLFLPLGLLACFIPLWSWSGNHHDESRPARRSRSTRNRNVRSSVADRRSRDRRGPRYQSPGTRCYHTGRLPKKGCCYRDATLAERYHIV